MQIVPRVKFQNINTGEFLLNKNNYYYIDDNSLVSFVDNLFNFVTERFLGLFAVHFVQNTVEQSKIIFKKVKSDIPEFYTISICENEILVGYADKLGLRNSIATINALIEINEANLVISCMQIKDYPDNKRRSAMFDLVRDFIPIDDLKYYIKELGFAKYNCVHLHLMDSQRYALKSEALPELNKNDEWFYTKEELIDLVKYASGLGLDLLPEIDIPGHNEALLQNIPEMKCVHNGEPIGVWTFCISREENYVILDKMIAELVEIFPYEYFHIGGDEISFHDLKKLEYWQRWDDCDRCKKLFEEHGLKNETDGLYYFIRRMHEMLKKYNKRMVVWNDGIDISTSPDIPRDILIQFWRVALPTRGPSMGCSMQRFLEEGFEVVNAYFEETYIDVFVKEEKLVKWNPFSSPYVPEKYQKSVCGGEICAWDYPVHYRFSLAPAFLVFADRVWNNTPIDNIDYITKALTRQLICPDRQMLDVFKILGSVIFPNNEYACFDESKISKNLDLYDDAIVELKKWISRARKNRQFVETMLLMLISARQFVRVEKGLPTPDLTLSAYVTPLDVVDEDNEGWQIWKKSMGY